MSMVQIHSPRPRFCPFCSVVYEHTLLTFELWCDWEVGKGRGSSGRSVASRLLDVQKRDFVTGIGPVRSIPKTANKEIGLIQHFSTNDF